MPDVRFRVFRGDYPDQSFIGTMRIGDKFLWIPDTETRRMGVPVILYILENYRDSKGRRHTACMPYSCPGLHMMPHG